MHAVLNRRCRVNKPYTLLLLPDLSHRTRQSGGWETAVSNLLTDAPVVKGPSMWYEEAALFGKIRKDSTTKIIPPRCGLNAF